MDEKKSYQILQFAEDRDGYVSVSEAKRFGIAQTYLVLAEEEGQFEKVAKGLYVKKGYPIDPHYILHYRYPKAVFHLLSAAYLHGWIGNEGNHLSVKCPRNYMTSGIAGAQVSHASPADYQLGIGLVVTRNGLLVPATDKERTVVDIVRHQAEFSSRDFKEIIENAFAGGLDEQSLLHYAKQLRQENEIDLLLKLYQ